MHEWNDTEIYALSFLVYANEDTTYKGVSHFPECTISYNTEAGCDHASAWSEERWNVAFWETDRQPVILAEPDDEGARILWNWYQEMGIDHIGYEDEDTMYNEDMEYIGKGPAGYYELLCAVSNVARTLQQEGTIAAQFGRIPILVHDLEYAWYAQEATAHANPNKEADAFLEALKKGFPE